MQKPMRIKRIGYNGNVETIGKSNLLGHKCNLIIHLFGLFYTEPFMLCQKFMYAFGGIRLHVWRQLETFPFNLNSVFLWKLIKCSFKFAFADVAERTHNI